MSVQRKFKVINPDSTSVTNETEYAGLWPISTRDFSDAVYYDEAAREYRIRAKALAAIPALDVSFGQLEVESGNGRTSYKVDPTGQLTTRQAPEREALTLADIVGLLNSADDLAARGSAGPWKTGKGGGRTGKALASATNRIAQLELHACVMDWCLQIMTREGVIHYLLSLPSMAQVTEAARVAQEETTFKQWLASGKTALSRIDNPSLMLAAPEGVTPTHRLPNWERPR